MIFLGGKALSKMDFISEFLSNFERYMAIDRMKTLKFKNKAEYGKNFSL